MIISYLVVIMSLAQNVLMDVFGLGLKRKHLGFVTGLSLLASIGSFYTHLNLQKKKLGMDQNNDRSMCLTLYHRTPTFNDPKKEAF